MTDLISEPITPLPGVLDAAAMARGEPGLPTGFGWRGQAFTILERLDGWKESSREGGHAQGELYLRRHYYKLRMSDQTIWTVYCLRQTPRSGNPKRRWHLYTRENIETAKRQNGETKEVAPRRRAAKDRD